MLSELYQVQLEWLTKHFLEKSVIKKHTF
jgi:hypothetical protein